ncbi:MAG: metallophosphatase domain-containing protein [Bacteroidota bacterium]
MQLTLLADTHGLHRQLPELAGEVLIHAGDFCGPDRKALPVDFFDWLADLDFRHKILIAGNHDFIAEEQPDFFVACLPPEVIYLEDDGCWIEGYHFWGSPVTPNLPSWAFGKHQQQSLHPHWEKIPATVDILITHTPPAGTLDQSSAGYELGCPELSSALPRIKPKLHVFGHVHNSYGEVKEGGIHFVNAANMKSGGGLSNLPIEVTLP